MKNLQEPKKEKKSRCLQMKLLWLSWPGESTRICLLQNEMSSPDSQHNISSIYLLLASQSSSLFWLRETWEKGVGASAEWKLLSQPKEIIFCYRQFLYQELSLPRGPHIAESLTLLGCLFLTPFWLVLDISPTLRLIVAIFGPVKSRFT